MNAPVTDYPTFSSKYSTPEPAAPESQISQSPLEQPLPEELNQPNPWSALKLPGDMA